MTDLNVNQYGEGEPIIFIHGFSLGQRMWQKQVEYFAKTNRVITYDMRGFGKSPIPVKLYSHHQDLKGLLDEIGISKVHVVGLSLGGEVVVDFALSYPEMVMSLVLADSSLGGYVSTVDWRVYAKEQGLTKAKENWLNHPVFAPIKNKPEVLDELKIIVNDYSGWHWFNKDFRERLSPVAMDRLSEIKIPTKIIVGESDLDYFKDIAKIIHEKVVGSSLEIVKNSGHMVNMEKPEEFNQVLVQHILQASFR